MRGHLKKRSANSWTIWLELDRDPATGKRRQKTLTIRGPKKLAAAKLAWQEGADAVEADFRLTADGRLVAIHDESTLRISGVDLCVAETTLDELKQLDVGAWKDRRSSGERLATLEEMRLKNLGLRSLSICVAKKTMIRRMSSTSTISRICSGRTRRMRRFTTGFAQPCYPDPWLRP